MSSSQESKITPIKNSHPLTQREIECLHYLIAGHAAKMIARQLNISPRTVEEHIENIKNKLGVSRKIEIIHKVTNLALINEPLLV